MGSRRRGTRLSGLLCGAGLAAAVLGGTAPVHGQPAPSVLPRDVLPLPDQPFQGRIGDTTDASVADWPSRLEAPAGAPNILLVLTDDVGFAASSAFGGPIPTPNLDRLAANGLRYNRFHTTALCSPTRAALLTGRNAHRVGTGNLTDLPMGFPGYNGVFPQSAATIARILQLNGYSTAMFGKHHNVPASQQSAAGPFTQWPTSLGFDYFYGFIGGDVHQWQPKLYRGTVAVDESERAGELLDQRLAEDAIRWVHNQKAAAPDRPFLLYLAPGSLHAPHHAPADWINRFKGKFDAGWDVLREQTYRRQRADGIIPRGAALTPRPPQIPAWSSLGAEDRAYSARMMEVAAAALSFQDAQFGKLIGELERMGELDNTLVIFVEGDNGASGEATQVGTSNELGELLNGVKDSPRWLHGIMDLMGGPKTYQNYSMGWAWALDTPFQWTKQFASYLGGTRNGLVISWPGRIEGAGSVRSQFSHVIDIAPTILEAAGLPAPSRVHGVEQMSMDGKSLVPTFSQDTDTLRTQYFEISGAVGIYHDGWFAGRASGRMPWESQPPEGAPPQWELYDLRKDFSQSRDIARRNPSKLAEMQTLFRKEAQANNVYPIDTNFSFRRAAMAAKPAAARPPRTHFTYWSVDTSVAQAAAPNLGGKAFSIEAMLDIPSGASGVIVATGSRFGGWSFYLDDGRPTAVQAFTNSEGNETRIAAAERIPAGRRNVIFRFQPRDGGGAMAGGRLTILDGDKVIAQGDIAKTINGVAGIGESFDIGRDTGSPVTDYPFPAHSAPGWIERVDVLLGK